MFISDTPDGYALEIILSQDYHSSKVRDEVFERVSYGTVSLREEERALITLPADPFDEKSKP